MRGSTTQASKVWLRIYSADHGARNASVDERATQRVLYPSLHQATHCNFNPLMDALASQPPLTTRVALNQKKRSRNFREEKANATGKRSEREMKQKAKQSQQTKNPNQPDTAQRLQ